MRSMRLRRQPRILAGLFGRLVAVATALVFLLGYLSTWQHLATVVHVACAEHQSVEDLPTALASATRTTTVALSAAPAPGGNHHPCELPPSLRGGAALVRGPQVQPGLAPLPERVVSLAPAADNPTGVPLLMLAPKASPPTA